MEVPQNEVVKFYNRFYSESDFAYYAPSFSMRVLKSLMRRCGLQPASAVLDVGCGTGYYSDLFRRLGYDCTGIDISEAAIDKARRQYPQTRFAVADVMALPYTPASFDAIFALGVSLANTRDTGELHRFISYLMEFVKPHGWLLFLGGSNLSGMQSPTSSWFNHSWPQIQDFVPTGPWKIHGPYLTHFRFLGYLPFLALNPFTTHAIRLLGGSKERRIVCLLRKM